MPVLNVQNGWWFAINVANIFLKMNALSKKTHLVVDPWGPMELLRVDAAAVGQELASYLQAASYRTNNKLRRHDSKG